jgi:hypothetical protein
MTTRGAKIIRFPPNANLVAPMAKRLPWYVRLWPSLLRPSATPQLLK